jgi:hypothetical protein
MSKSHCKCNTCITFNCDDCTTCDICHMTTGCKDEDNNRQDKEMEDKNE